MKIIVSVVFSIAAAGHESDDEDDEEEEEEEEELELVKKPHEKSEGGWPVGLNFTTANSTSTITTFAGTLDTSFQTTSNPGLRQLPSPIASRR